MLRTVIRDFEVEQVGGVGFAPLSQISGQCSIYPLGLTGSRSRKRSNP
jgi:hypothetical protein